MARIEDEPGPGLALDGPCGVVVALQYNRILGLFSSFFPSFAGFDRVDDRLDV
jgi:hypothetical protein